MKKERSLLIITPYFAPQSHAAVFRAYKLAKYLPARGWNVHVLTVDRNYLYNEDENLLEDLPANVTIHRAKYIEPTLRGLRMAFGGKDRTFKALKHDAVAAAGAKPSWFTKVYRFLRELINSPDVYWTWKRPALSKAEEIIRRHNIGVVMTSSLPYTTLEIGAALKRKLGVRWVADLRDPLTYEFRMHSPRPSVFAKQRAIEKLAIDHADAITTLTSTHPLILADTYGPDNTRHSRFIPTGLDTGFLPEGNPRPAREPYLIFVGEYLAQYGDEFFRVLRETLNFPEVASANLKLKIVGHMGVNRARLAPLLKDLNLEQAVEFVDHVPQPEVYRLIQSARAAVICTSRVYPWWVSFAKLVDFIALKKPVIALVPDPSETRKWLQLTGLGVFLDGTGAESARRLREFLLSPAAEDPKGDEAQCRKFLSDFQVSEFERTFNEALDRG